VDNRQIRVITAVVLVPPVMAGIAYLSDVVFFAVLLCLILGGTWEFYKLLEAGERSLMKLPTAFGAVVIPFSVYVGGGSAFVFGIFIFVLSLLIFKLFGRTPLDKTYEQVAMSMLAVLYYPFFMSFFFPLREISYHWIFFLCVVTWMNDSFAYLVGVMFGKRKMYEIISPKKSMEGLAGGFAGGVIGGVAYGRYFMDLSMTHTVIISVLLVAVGVAGDLVESMFKRKSGIKDSGVCFPGHGGILDRTDSIAFAVPVLYFYVTIMGLYGTGV
jgi:phosphatidate cytidylyltransferase